MRKDKVLESVFGWSVKRAVNQNGLNGLVSELRAIIPDISDQESSERPYFNEYTEVKRRALQSFQLLLLQKAVELIDAPRITIVDIGDSAGSHMLYAKNLIKDKEIDTVSVNLDPNAVKKIEKRGLKAVFCRAENLDLGGRKIDLFTSFQMVEHLHNPSIFFKRLADRTSCDKMLITVPYLKTSRVALHSIRKQTHLQVNAEQEHIFELNPSDWELIFLHSGWKIKYSRIYFQYPKGIPILSQILGYLWRYFDYEGFWGAILEKDTSYMKLYQDWEE
ncbi:MAG: methyltransferase domain-containing protein [Elusimicrobiota bacterium]